MLSFLKITNIALIESLEVDFGPGLNLLTGETGSGKSIIVDSLGALAGGRVSADIIRDGEEAAKIEGMFIISSSTTTEGVLTDAGIDFDNESETELIIRREITRSGKNRIFINDKLVTQVALKKIGAFVVDIHGQGEQASLFDESTHIELLDQYAVVGDLEEAIATAFRNWSVIRSEIGKLEKDESEKLQLIDVLKFQVDEIKSVALVDGEDDELYQEKRRMNSIEKLSALSEEAFALLYENSESTAATLDRAARKIEELAEFESIFREGIEGMNTARAVIEDLAITARDFRSRLEFSPQRLEEIETRLAEISRLKRKYGDSIHAVLSHLRDSEDRLESFENAEFREEELKKKLLASRGEYLMLAIKLHEARKTAAVNFEKDVELNLKAVALDKARFEVRFESLDESKIADGAFDSHFTAKGIDLVTFYFSANPGESPKPLVKIASGGEASRLMLILKTTAKAQTSEKAAVFDEIDIGIGGRVAEAVGRKLKDLSRHQQVLCVTHQPQIASLADLHLVVEKQMLKDGTKIKVKTLDAAARLEEIARMLAGEMITDAARVNAAEMIAAGGVPVQRSARLKA
ncbi:MAG: DNA repair protein RecN [Pyrinomonadaceae bacterium]